MLTALEVIGYIALAVLAYALMNLLVVAALFRTQVRELVALLRSRGEEAGADDVMAVADAVAEGDGDFYDTDLRQNFEADEWGVFERNWMPLTDPQRALLHKQFDAIVEGADR